MVMFLTYFVKAQVIIENSNLINYDSTTAIVDSIINSSPGYYLSKLDKNLIKTNILIDRIINFRKDINLYNGNNRVKTCNYFLWKMLYNNLKYANNDTALLPNIDPIQKYLVNMGHRENIYSIPILNLQFNGIKKEALLRNDFIIQDSFLIDNKTTDDSYYNNRIIIASPFATRIHGDNVIFQIDSSLYFSNLYNEKIINIEVDFDDGLGWQEFQWNTPLVIKYNSESKWVLVKLKFIINSKAIVLDSLGNNIMKDTILELYSHFTFLHTGSSSVPNPSDISEKTSLKKGGLYELTAPNSNIMHFGDIQTQTLNTCWYTWFNDSKNYNKVCVTWQVENGQMLDYNILFGKDNLSGKLRKPFIVVDGFDPGNVRDYFETLHPDPANDDMKSVDYRGLYELMNGVKSAWSNDPGATLVTDLTQNGYDVVFVNWTGGDIDIPTNANYFRRFLNEVINTPKFRDNLTEEIILVGPSMGGIITRYALTTMEQATPPEEHHVKQWISFDSPQRGANIPISVQCALQGLEWRLEDLDDGVSSFKVHDVKLQLIDKINKLKSTAARQMLLYHITAMGNNEDEIKNNYAPNNLNSVLKPDIKFNELYAKLDKLGYPKYSKNIAMSNGGYSDLYDNSLKGIGHFRVKAALLGVVLFAFPIYALKVEDNIGLYPNNTFVSIPSSTYGSNYELCSAYSVGLDNLPGGYHTALYDFNQDSGNDIDIDWTQTQYSKACFMPTCSTFGIYPDILNAHKTWKQIQAEGYNGPFDVIHGMGEYGNEEHVRVTDKTSIWLQTEIIEKDRRFIQKPFIHIYDVNFDETESNACLYTAKELITFGGVKGSSFTIKDSADVKVISPVVRLRGGFKIEKGAVVSIKSQNIVNGLKSLKINTNQINSNTDYTKSSNYKNKIYNYLNNIENNYNSQIIDSLLRVSIYPNPTNDFINILINTELITLYHISIKNIFGQIFYQNDWLSNKIYNLNLSNLPKGIYFVYIENQNKIQTHKLILK